MKTKKIRAFTVSELLVVMVISSIVISITFIVLGLVQQQLSQIQKVYRNQQEVLMLKRVLLKDMNMHHVSIDVGKGHVQFTNTIDTIAYNFTPTFIVRDRDTFYLKTKSRQFLLENTIVRDGWIDAIQLEFEDTFTAKNLFVYKIKDAAYYLNQ